MGFLLVTPVPYDCHGWGCFDEKFSGNARSKSSGNDLKQRISLVVPS